jgi:hypothetical protein
LTRWKRVAFSLLSAIFAELLLALAISIPGGKHLFYERIVVFTFFATSLVIPGWLLSLPFLLVIRKTDGWRLGLMAFIGISIGPIIDLGMDLWSFLSSPTAAFNVYLPWLYMATAISTIATALYLTALKLFSRPTHTPATQTN